MLMNMFFVYYNGPRSQERIGRAPSEVNPPYLTNTRAAIYHALQR